MQNFTKKSGGTIYE
ncbi:MAG: hypothetical protein E7592_04690 [Ruminococcaceae bacterium]|nr:hypothetical protein [Oscillospiraceae bacterium]